MPHAVKVRVKACLKIFVTGWSIAHSRTLEGDRLMRNDISESLRRPMTLPVNVERTALKAQQCEIIEHLNKQGLTYDDIAKLLGLGSGATIRGYVARNPKLIKANNKNIRVIHDALTNPSHQLREIVPDVLINKYFSLFDNTQNNDILYRPRLENEQSMSESNLHALSRIVADIFRADEALRATASIKRICGKYYAYRISHEKNTVVKSYLEITELRHLDTSNDESSSFFVFKHFHPDRLFETEHDEPRRTNGIVFFLNNNVYLVGSTEGGQAPSIFALREPIRQNFNRISGFTLTTNMDHVLFTALTVLVKDKSAIESGVCRIKLGASGEISKSEFDMFAEVEKFDLRILMRHDSNCSYKTLASVRI